MTDNNDKHHALRALIARLENSENHNLSKTYKHQYAALIKIVAHARKYSTYFKEKLSSFNLSSDKVTFDEYLNQLPILSRRDIQSAGEILFCANQPSQIEIQTSGSTGEPVKIRKANINHLFWLAHTFREHRWWQRDLTGRLAMIRAGIAEKEHAEWSSPLNILYKTGPSFSLPIDTDINKQIEWLQKQQPDYLLTYPSNLLEIIRALEEKKTTIPSIKGIRLMAETLQSEMHHKVNNFFKVPVTDMYSSQEVGYIALQCPDCNQYHVMAENLIVEVLDENNKSCSPGETGRIVVTDLYNTVTPLVRYDIGDYAVIGEHCSKRPGLPSLKQILGRERNMLLLPNGEHFWPILGYKHYRDIADIKQYQIAQIGSEDIEMRLVVGSPLNTTQEKQLTTVLNETLGYPFNIKFTYFPDRLPKSKNGKFEEFVCDINN